MSDIGHDLASRLANGEAEDIAALLSEGQHAKAIEHGSQYLGDVAYLPSCRRAAMVTNGGAVWFDADSLEDAVAAVENGEYADRT